MTLNAMDALQGYPQRMSIGRLLITHTDVLSFCRAITNAAPSSKFFSTVANARPPLTLVSSYPSGSPDRESPSQSVLRNDGDERRKNPWSLSSVNLGERSARDSLIAAP